MSKTSKTNPAYRLHQLMVRMRNASQKGRTIRDALIRAHNLKDANDFEIARKQFLTAELVNTTEELIRSLEGIGDHATYLRFLPQARKGLLSSELGADSKNYTAFANAFSDTVLQSIEFCASRIGESYREQTVEDSDLEAIDSQVAAIFKFTTQADIDPDLRKVSLDILQTLRTSIADYRIRGADGLESSLALSLGKLNLYYRRTEDSKSGNRIEQIKKILEVMVKFETLISKGISAIPVLAQWGHKLIG